MSFLLRIQDQIKTTIEAINTDAGYNLNWGTVNVRDEEFMQFPSCWIFFDGEDGLNELDESNAGAYSNLLNVRLTIKTQLNSSEFDPRLSNRDELYMALEDIKKAFANETIENAGVLPPIYQDFEIIDNGSRGDTFLPSYLVMNWQIKYDQDRNDPSVVAC